MAKLWPIEQQKMINLTAGIDKNQEN